MAIKQFALTIGDKNYTPMVAYPIKIEDTTLTDKLSTYNIPLKATEDAAPLSPHKVSTLTILEDGAVAKSKNLILLTDSVSKNGVRDNYDHQLELIEATYRLELAVLPNMAITRVEDKYEPTLLDAIRKILDIGGLESVKIDDSTAEILDEIDSPEWTFTRMTVLEAVRLVMNHEVSLIPYMEVIDTLTHKEIVDTTTSTAPDVDKFITKSSAYDPQTYRSNLFSPADNVVAGENLQEVIEPKNGWMTVRSSEERITADNADIHTQFPIYAMDQLWLNGTIYYVETESDDTIRYEGKRIEDIGLDKLYSLASFMYESQEYQVLENNTDIEPFGEASEEDNYMNVKSGKGSSLFYERGQTNILGLSDTAPSKFRWSPNRQTIFEIVNYLRKSQNRERFYEDNSLVDPDNQSIRGAGLIKPQYLDSFIEEMQAQGNMESSDLALKWLVFVPEGFDTNFLYMGLTLSVQGTNEIDSDDLFKLQFRVQYYPLTDTTLKSYRPYINEDEYEVKSSQYYNQTSTVISSSALGELHKKLLERGSGNQELMNYLHKSTDDMIDTGIRTNDYVVSAANHVINATSIQSDYTFNQYKQKLNKYVGVLEEYRQYLIPNENIVQRDVAVDLFVKADFKQTTYQNTELISRELYIGDQSCRTIQLTADGGIDRYYIPAISYGFNNAAVITGNTETNNLIGYSLAEDDDVDFYRKPAVYTDKIGQVKNIHIRAGAGVHSDWTIEDSNNWPITSDEMESPLLWQGWHTVRKDAREQLNFNISFHHVSNTPKINFTSEWPKAIGMTGGEGFEAFDVVMLDSKPRNNTLTGITIIQTRKLNYSIDSDSIKLGPNENQVPIQAVAWGITYKGKLLMWVDEIVDTSTSPVWLNFDRVFNKFNELPHNDVHRVRLRSTNDAPIEFSSPSVGTITTTSIDLLIPAGDNVSFNVPQNYAGEEFQVWFTPQQTIASTSRTLSIGSLNSDIDWFAGYQ